jgi:hypothetical protein
MPGVFGPTPSEETSAPGTPCKLGRVYVLYGFCTDGHPTIYAVAESEEPLRERAVRVLEEEDPLTATVEELFWQPSTLGGEQAQLDADGHCWLYIVRVERLAAS